MKKSDHQKQEGCNGIKKQVQPKSAETLYACFLRVRWRVEQGDGFTALVRNLIRTVYKNRVTIIGQKPNHGIAIGELAVQCLAHKSGGAVGRLRF